MVVLTIDDEGFEFLGGVGGCDEGEGEEDDFWEFHDVVWLVIFTGLGRVRLQFVIGYSLFVIGLSEFAGELDGGDHGGGVGEVLAGDGEGGAVVGAGAGFGETEGDVDGLVKV